MKRGKIISLLTALCLFCSSAASAAPGMTDDPVVTMRYLQDEYLPSIKAKAEAAVAKRMSSFVEQARNLSGTTGSSSLPSNEQALIRKIVSRINLRSGSFTPVTLKAGSVLTLGQGASVQITSGNASHGGGTLVDATIGRDIASQGALSARHKYFSLSVETKVKIASDTSLLVSGTFRITPPYEPMYKDLCDALVTMHVINTYELERITPRIEMFVIFVSIMGVKRDAYSYTGTHPFKDVPEWGQAYVAYLYNNGHTSGTSNTTFSPNDTGSVQQMCFIMLKALGYKNNVDITYENAVSDAIRLGLFTKREMEILQTEEFTRDTMMYMTYYSLFATYKDSTERVIDRLISNGQIKAEYAAEALVSVKRTRF